MIRALILPYVQRPGLAGCEITIIATDEGPSIVEQHEIGRIVDLTEPRPLQRRHRREQWQTKERQITDDDVRAAVAWAQGILLRYGVTECDIQIATGDGATAQRSQRVGAAMKAGLYTAERIAGSDSGTLSELRGVDGDFTALQATLEDSNGLQNGRGVDDSDRNGDRRGSHSGTGPRGSEGGAGGSTEEPEPSGVRPGDAMVLGGNARDRAAPEPGAAADKQGARILGVDPGSHWVACTVAEIRSAPCGECGGADGWHDPAHHGGVSPLRYITSRVFEIGRVVAIKPRTVTRRDGSTYTIATKRIVEDADIGALLRAVMAWLEPLQIDRAVLERATHFRTDAPSEGAGGARATGLARAQWIGGELAGTLRAALYDAEEGRDNVQTVAAPSWRAVARRGAQAWREGVIAAFGASWPGQLGEHAIDAGGCIVWAARGPAARAAEPRAPRVKAERRERTAAEKHAARDARARRARKARAKKGCACHGRHRRECPLFVPMTYKKGA